jgi:hypothetical protein
MHPDVIRNPAVSGRGGGVKETPAKSQIERDVHQPYPQQHQPDGPMRQRLRYCVLGRSLASGRTSLVLTHLGQCFPP